MDTRTLDRALALKEEGKHNEAAELFLYLAKRTDRAFERAGMLLNVTDSLKSAGHLAAARDQLDAVRGLLAIPQDAALAKADEEMRHRILIGVELEEARISAAEGEAGDAMARLNSILAGHGAELGKHGLADLYQAIQRDRAFLLADSGRCEEALPILMEVDSADPHDRWTLFYLGYCYLDRRKFIEAQEKLEEAIHLGLTPDFQGRAHCALGAVFYEQGDYARAKSELEMGVKTVSPKFIKESGIWKWLEYTCISLGLMAEADHYGRLARCS
jgi:tetratricopeptide (TPR) repeat protein